MIMITLLPGGARGKMVHKNSQELRPARRSRVPGTSRNMIAIFLRTRTCPLHYNPANVAFELILEKCKMRKGCVCCPFYAPQKGFQVILVNLVRLEASFVNDARIFWGRSGVHLRLYKQNYNNDHPTLKVGGARGIEMMLTYFCGAHPTCTNSTSQVQ